MLIILIRAAILYFTVTIGMRLMGKRQLGELQPTELVVTFLLSEIAAIPLQDNGMPLTNSIVCIALLVSFEIISSVICLKSTRLRGVIEGNPIIVIRDGVIDQKKLRELRFSVDDVFEQLRQKNIFDINTVSYAIVETNGQLSVMLKPEKETVTAEMIDIKPHPSALMCVVVNDGRVIRKAFGECNMTDKKLDSLLRKNNVQLSDILFMLYDKNENCTIVKKEKNA